MKRFFMSIVLCWLVVHSLLAVARQPTLPTIQLASGLKVIQLQPTIYVVEDKDGQAPAYSMIAVMSDTDLLMVDAPYTPQNTAKVLQWVHKKWGDKKITEINTHYHLDRVGGNDVLVQKKIPVYGSDLTASLLSDPKAPNNKWKVRQDLAGYVNDPEVKQHILTMRITAPDHLFPLKEGKTLVFGDKKVEIFYPGPAHTPDNIVVYIPHLKVLFGGCMVVAFPKVFLVSDANPKTWPTSVSRLEKFQVDWVIPGHPASLTDDENFSPGLIQHTEMLFKQNALVSFSKKTVQGLQLTHAGK